MELNGISTLGEPNPALDAMARCGYEAVEAFHAFLDTDADAPPWEEASEAARQTARDMAFAVLQDQTIEEVHAAWCSGMRSQGWAYGETLSDAGRTHPALRPYAELTKDQQLRTSLFVHAVSGMFAALHTLTQAVDAAQSENKESKI